MRTPSRLLLAAALLAAPLLAASGAAALAEGMTAKEMTEARAKVQTAVALARIAKDSNDGDAMLVAARLIASAGPVAMGEPGADGKPSAMYDPKQMAAEAKAMGADAAKADMLAVEPTSKVSGATPPTGYWINTCDYSGYCAWAWLD